MFSAGPRRRAHAPSTGCGAGSGPPWFAVSGGGGLLLDAWRTPARKVSAGAPRPESAPRASADAPAELPVTAATGRLDNGVLRVVSTCLTAAQDQDPCSVPGGGAAATPAVSPNLRRGEHTRFDARVTHKTRSRGVSLDTRRARSSLTRTALRTQISSADLRAGPREDVELWWEAGRPAPLRAWERPGFRQRGDKPRILAVPASEGGSWLELRRQRTG